VLLEGRALWQHSCGPASGADLSRPTPCKSVPHVLPITALPKMPNGAHCNVNAVTVHPWQYPTLTHVTHADHLTPMRALRWGCLDSLDGSATHLPLDTTFGRSGQRGSQAPSSLAVLAVQHYVGRPVVASLQSANFPHACLYRCLGSELAPELLSMHVLLQKPWLWENTPTWDLSTMNTSDVIINFARYKVIQDAHAGTQVCLANPMPAARCCACLRSGLRHLSGAELRSRGTAPVHATQCRL
jgi:hypothetical protein